MKKTKILIILSVIIIMTVGWTIYSNRDGLLFFAKSQPEPENTEEAKVNLVIDSGQGQPLSLSDKFQTGMTAFDLLEYGKLQLNLGVKIKSYDTGIFVEKIGDKIGGQDGKYWLYYVNGEMPQVAADKKILNSGDTVEFKFEKSPF
jgi:hypothetical protein